MQIEFIEDRRRMYRGTKTEYIVTIYRSHSKWRVCEHEDGSVLVRHTGSQPNIEINRTLAYEPALQAARKHIIEEETRLRRRADEIDHGIYPGPMTSKEAVRFTMARVRQGRCF